jgi:hypothetical protein
MKSNIEKFGKLVDDGDTGDRKRTFLVADKNDGFRDVRIEIDTDDCDRNYALAFKKALIALWNAQ